MTAPSELVPTGNLLPREEVERRTGFKKTALYDMIGRGDFPAPLRDPATGTVRWLEPEVEAWKAEWVKRAERGGCLKGSRIARSRKAA